MNILYVYAHPNRDSFNASLKRSGITALESFGHTVNESDLYALRFKAQAGNDDFTGTSTIDQQYFVAQHEAYLGNNLHQEIQTEIEKIKWADHIILQFPLWWFSVPAILKGWLDRVFIKGFAYDAEHKFETGLLNNKTASFTITTQSPESAYQKNGAHGHSMEEFLLPLTHTLRFAGIRSSTPFIAYGAFNLSEHEAKNMMDNYQLYLRNILQS